MSEDGQRCFEQSRPFSSHASPRCPTEPHAMKEPHPNDQVGSRKESGPAGHLPETDRPANPEQETAAWCASLGRGLGKCGGYYV